MMDPITGPVMKKGEHDKQEEPDSAVLFNPRLLALGGELRLTHGTVKKLWLDDVTHYQNHNAVGNQYNDDFKEKIVGNRIKKGNSGRKTGGNA